MSLHREFAARWGVVRSARPRPPAPATAAYCNFLLRTASLGDFARAGRRGAAVHVELRGDRRLVVVVGVLGPLPQWIDMYASPEFAELAAWARSVVDEVSGGVDGMEAAFEASCEHEVSVLGRASAAAQDPGVAPAQRDLRAVEVLEVGLRVLA